MIKNLRLRTSLILVASHSLIAFVGFAAGVYLLPIITAPEGPTAEQMASVSSDAIYRGEFRRDLRDSDYLHWGEGVITLSREAILLQGEIAPGPDYKLYLSPEYVETEAAFQRLKPSMARVGDVKTFKDFIVAVPQHVDVSEYRAVIIWCETFAQFITAAQYR